MNLAEYWVFVVFGLVLLPAALTACNLFLFQPLRRVPAGSPTPRVSVLIPARNEEHAIAAAVDAALQSTGVELEVVVLDDQSSDATAAEVTRIAARDARVRLVRGEPLPEGWCGKQWACHQLARLARHDLLVWIDADVTLAADALARLAAHRERTGVALLSGVPFQVTGTWLEKLVVPLIHVVLLGYLPMAMMRRTASPSFGAGCGQLFMAQRVAYERCGGHGAAGVRASLHDGVTLPRAFRRAGLMTDVVDAGDLASCRMYRGAAAVWHGFAKNATEGMATPVGLPVWTVLLLGGHVLPWVLLVAWLSGAMTGEPWQMVVLWGAWLMAVATSVGVMYRFGQSWLAGVARPVGVAVLVAIQWWAVWRRLWGRPSSWKGRAYAS